MLCFLPSSLPPHSSFTENGQRGKYAWRTRLTLSDLWKWKKVSPVVGDRRRTNDENVLTFRYSGLCDNDDAEELDNTLKVVCSRLYCLCARFCIHVISRNTRTLFRRFGFSGHASNSTGNRVESLRGSAPFSTTAPRPATLPHPSFAFPRPPDPIVISPIRTTDSPSTTLRFTIVV